ncbi:hypothetical protein EPUS_08982 [Endocarpon pusillum Z07020]|uniref:Cytochrome b-c1 complex subunit 6, mitochondrial n=1 Tax=Endocarpon pusillum (strain Z07020 / HMAS-L-300199) TaxID=1263415 RepID=U1GGJ7_ENDPU|nr:uncharacterized protein EPUS_08982 [Endocarpon pusillum Z07020]ERF76797.1 hypothetical protein EPUS_08982 [Endocarpon pusillum Z07020]
MGITDFFSDLMATVGFHEAHAEAPAEEDEDNKDGGGDEDREEKSVEGDGGGEKAEEGGDEGGEKEEEEGEEAEAEEEEEEEDDEPVDPKPKMEAECAKSAQCAPYKHHYDECVERVTAMHEDPNYKGPKEDCVEEFFHLQHCATQCAAPKLFKALK